jgi:hypothetical protein
MSATRHMNDGSLGVLTKACHCREVNAVSRWRIHCSSSRPMLGSGMVSGSSVVSAIVVLEVITASVCET